MKAYKKIRRFRQIFTTLIKYGFEDVVERLKVPVKADRKKSKREPIHQRILSASLGERLRLLCEELGTTYIKLGQILSLRSDIIPEAVSSELQKLQDRVAPFAEDRIDGIFDEHLGRSVTELFKHFDYTPAAAASIAQVHRATTQAGEQVAVKIQRPDIVEVIETDLEILTDIAALIERYIPSFRVYKPCELAKQFAKTIRLELDFSHEGRNIELFRDKFRDDQTVHIPKVHWELSCGRILTMEHVQGLKLTELDLAEATHLDKRIIAVNGTKMILKQIFDFGFFHADPHPGNILVLEDNVIAPVDFGMVGFIDNQLKEQLIDALSAFINRDADKLLRVFVDVRMIDDSFDHGALRQDLKDLLQYYYNMPLAQVDLGRLVRELNTIVRTYHISLPVEFALLTKTLITAERLGKGLDPDFDIIELAKPFFRRLLLSKLDPKRNLEQLVDAVGHSLHLARDMPAELHAMLRKLQAGKLKLQFEHRGLERFISEIDRSINRLSFSIVIAAITIGSSLIIHLNVGPRILGLPAIGLVGFLLAGLSGIVFIVAVIRSGRL